MRFTHALVRKPCARFAEGITRADLGAPSPRKAISQWNDYLTTLKFCGVKLHQLPPDDAFPDSTFVEDTAVIAGGTAILTNPGAESRRGEVEAVRQALAKWLPTVELGGGTLDGGDVCEMGDRVLIGLSERTSHAGADALSKHLANLGIEATTVDLGACPELLHLKTGLSWLGEKLAVVHPALQFLVAGMGFETIVPPDEELYAANAIRVNDFVLMPAGCSKTIRVLRKRRIQVLEVHMSEFQKMDGGLSCLSLRW